jgi:hypothetical protein
MQETDTPPTEAKEAGFVIQNRLVHEFPSRTTALDIFKGIWISKFPGDLASYEGGPAPLFEDTRIPQSEPHLGTFAGKRVLDLGPLEGGQAYVAERAGAEHVTAVETNALNYLKCLVAKEVLGMKKVSFLCGDVVEFLRHTTDPFDICVCCGILYHMVDPVELIGLVGAKIDKVLIWTHYYDPVDTARNKVTHTVRSTKAVDGVEYTYHRQEYGAGFSTNVYCGGLENYSSWMSKEDILKCLQQSGFGSATVLGDGDSISGPYVLIAASK